LSRVKKRRTKKPPVPGEGWLRRGTWKEEEKRACGGKKAGGGAFSLGEEGQRTMCPIPESITTQELAY